MPRTAFDKQKYPPINRLRASILERKFMSGLSWDDLAKSANISGAYMRKINRKDPWDWPREIRLAVCRKLQIKTTQMVDGEWSDE